MPVFDFSNSKTEKKDPECTYTTFQSNEKSTVTGETDPDH